MTRRRGLGRGLDALIPSDLGPEPAGVLELPPERIRRNPRQPRGAIDPQSLADLTESIRQHGVLQPLIVSPALDGDYDLVAGERRLQAARQAGLATVPVLVRRVDDQGRLALALIENLQRSDLNALEAAEGFRQLAEEFSLSHEQIAAVVGKSRAAVSNTLRLLRLAPAARQALSAGQISEGHARALLSLGSAKAQAAALQSVLRRELNVRQTEELVRRLGGERVRRTRARPRPPEEGDLESRLRAALGTRVTLRRGRRGGTLIVHFFSDEELNALVDRILSGA